MLNDLNSDTEIKATLGNGYGGGGGPYEDIHDQHPNTSCMWCHRMHGGLMPTNDTCLFCHRDDVGDKHHDKWNCTKCHNGKGNRGNGN